MATNLQDRYAHFAEQMAQEGIDLNAVKERLKSQVIETPSWGYADSGTRFGVFRQAGVPRTVHEKIADAAQVQRMTGIAPSVALHIPWDYVDDWRALKEYADSLGMRLGAINPNLFQEQEYMLGSVCHPDAAVRERAMAHVAECVEVMKATGSKDLSLWLADGTNYPGQDDLRARKRRLEEAILQTAKMLPDDARLLIEYKFFEPAFYSTDIPDWGMALLLAQKAGQNARVLVDLGHHAQGVNVEQIVAVLLDEGKLGGFHFNNRKYADDDLTTGSINPYELFLIYAELTAEPQQADAVAYMIDQAHNEKPKIAAMIQSVVAIQRAYAKALLINRTELARCRDEKDIVGAEEVLVRAFNHDVTPLLEMVRTELGVPTDPLAAHRASGYFERVAKERVGGTRASGLGS